MWVPTLPTLRPTLVPTLVPTLPARHLGKKNFRNHAISQKSEKREIRNPKKQIAGKKDEDAEAEESFLNLSTKSLVTLCEVSARRYNLISDHWYLSILLAYLPVIAKLPTFSSTGGGGSLVRASHEDIFVDFQEKIWKFASHLLHPGTKTFIFKEDSHISLSNANTPEYNWRYQIDDFHGVRVSGVPPIFWSMKLMDRMLSAHTCSRLLPSVSKPHMKAPGQWRLTMDIQTREANWKPAPAFGHGLITKKLQVFDASIRNLWIIERDLNETCESESSNVSNSAKLRCVMMDWSNQALSKQKQSYANSHGV